jgi:hypothetical protein
MAEETVDAILGQDLLNLDSFSDEHMKQFIDMILKFIIDTKVRRWDVRKLNLFYRAVNYKEKLLHLQN